MGSWEWLLAIELGGVARGESDGEGEHAEGADDAAEVEEEDAVVEEVGVGAAEDREVGGDEEEAELGGAEEEL
jgi:hypothetical protein